MAKTSIKQKDEMIKLREQGMTYQAIANLYGVSRQCIEQIVNRERVLKQKSSPEYKKKAKEYYYRNKEKINERTRNWFAKHPNYLKAYYKRRKENKNSIDK